MTSTPCTRTAALPLDAADEAADSVERTGFDIGWDHARHGLVPPAELLLEGTPPGQGWRAGRAVFGGRTLAAPRPVRQWLALRLQAWRRGIAFEGQQLTPHYLAQIEADRCPVLRTPLGGRAGTPDAAVVERLNEQAAYAAGNLATLSQRAAQARSGVDAVEALRRARRLEARAAAAPGAAVVDGLDAGAWFRLAALQSYATPLPFHAAAQMPLALLPPNRVRLLNAAQGLQALLTLQFTRPGWAARTRAIGAWLPEHTLRHDYQLFIGALAPRLLEANAQGLPPAQVLEDAWLHERVQRRWQHFVLSLGEVATAALLDRLAAQGLDGVRLLSHGTEQATEGWALADRGQVPRSARLSAAARPRPRWPAAPRPAARAGTDRPPRCPAPQG
ncbi:MAG: hypothetical protein KGK09_02700 [Burkholderiales bacterium]|nr:hypothetical protein [Burkholderiales bacterium]